MIRYTIIDATGNYFKGNSGKESHFDTEKEAKQALKNLLYNNNTERLKTVYGDLNKLKIVPIDCYSHGEAKASFYSL